MDIILQFNSTILLIFSKSKKIGGLVINEKLNSERDHKPNEELVRWEQKMKKDIEYRTFWDRGDLDLEEYLKQGKKYNEFSDVKRSTKTKRDFKKLS